MLYITTSHKKEIEWHVGEKVPKIAPGLVVEIQADGHELEHIRKLFTSKLTIFAPPGETGPESIDFNFPSLPMPNKRVCSWCGDFARTIFANL